MTRTKSGRLPDVFRPVVDDVSAVALPWLRMSANDQIACAASINARKQCQAGSGPCDNEATVVETCKEAVYVTICALGGVKPDASAPVC